MQAGLVATIHEQPVNFGGWIGTGYSLVDPLTGSGAYRIGGGEDRVFLNITEDQTKVFFTGAVLEGAVGVLGYLKEFSAGGIFLSATGIMDALSAIATECAGNEYMEYCLQRFVLLYALVAALFVFAPHWLPTLGGFLRH